MKDNPTRIYFVRHGKTAQTGTILYGHNKGIVLDAEGIDQAEKTGEYLSKVKLDKIYSSPLERAFETAEKIAFHHDLEVEVIDDLIDTDCGIWTGRTLIDVAKEKDWEIVQKTPSKYKFEGGESFQDLFVRMNREIELIVQNNKGKSIAVVSHRDPIIMLVSYYLGMPMDDFQKIPCAPASVTIVNFKDKNIDVKGIGILPASRIEE